MRLCVFFLGWVSFLLAIGGCDRLPAVGGEGQKCFGNGTCEGDLVCEEGVCVEGCVPSCADKGCGESDGCAGTCSACPSGNWCDGTSCQPCDTAEHCGDACSGCTADPRGDACVDMGGFQCGCQTDLNCSDNQYCDLVTRGCLDCTVDDNCGLTCLDCSQQATNRQCVGEGGQENLHCGCETETYCAQGEACDPVSRTCDACQPDCGGRVCGANGCGGQCPPGCNVGTETCNADGQCESCSNDCNGLACGTRNGCGLECDGLGVECAAGTFCESDGACVACGLAAHCGELCVDCTGDEAGHQCVTTGGPPHCGCIDTSDCPADRACRAGLCEACTPDCDGKCGGADDTCDRT